MSEKWDFDCPQFVDFAAALNSPSNEVFYDIANDVQGTATVERGDFGPKMATPKVNPNDPLKNYPSINFSTDDEKLATLSQLPARLSKSHGCLDLIVNSLNIPGDKEISKMCRSKRRTSFPVNYIRSRRVLPITPNCLKRSMQNSKLKNAKTSEQLELQKIAELQNMLHKRLRLNEINLKRLKINKAPLTLEKLPKRSESKVPSIKISLARPSKPACVPNRNCHYINNIACGATAFSINNPDDGLQTKEKLNVAAKKKAASNVLRDRNVLEKNNDASIKKLPLFKKSNAHNGIKFLPHQKQTTPRPFSFDTSTASSCNTSHLRANLSEIHTSFSVSRNIVLENKENY